MTRKTMQPRFTNAKFATTCAETGKPIEKGAPMAYYPATRSCYHPDSKQAGELRAAEFANAYGMADANH
jgi:hypothetical protein